MHLLRQPKNRMPFWQLITGEGTNVLHNCTKNVNRHMYRRTLSTDGQTFLPVLLRQHSEVVCTGNKNSPTATKTVH